ncbi:MAG: polysaccharide deacetylase family protein [Gammaproteobacteria bacterium]|nr:polysaccharide deacetylase family protein [Gammaproteobacteria bacterium]MDH5802498.1 polysaccharide deacetylase family protein [Gammaproteobacteria bacterium]
MRIVSKQTLCVGWILLWLVVLPTAHGKQLTVLTYHDVVTEFNGDMFSVTRSEFVAQMDHLYNNNYHVISLSELKVYEKYPEQMPEKTIILTFDDGLKSYGEFVVPLLKIYGFPSVASIVTGWLDDQDIPREYHTKLMNWATLKKLNNEPLVEIVSHSNNLHRGVRANPQDIYEAAGVTRMYLAETQTYETETQFRQRISKDLQTSATRLRQELGIVTDTIVWPYGLYDEVIIDEAKKLGFVYQLSLDDGPTGLNQLPKLNRIMLLAKQSITDFANELTYASLKNLRTQMIEISLDTFTGKSLKEKEQLLSDALDRHQKLGANTLVISPFDKPGKQAFFYNRQTPIATDILSRVINSFRSKLAIRYVFLKLPAQQPATDPSTTYEDLARLVKFNGVIFAPNTRAHDILTIRQTINRFKSNIRYGVYGIQKNPFRNDFVVAPINPNEPIRKTREALAPLKDDGETIYYLAVQNTNDNKGFFEKAEQTFDFLDARHIGYKLLTQKAAASIKLEQQKSEPTKQALEQAPPEHASSEHATPKQAIPEQAIPEQATPKQTTPKQTTPEQTTPEQPKQKNSQTGNTVATQTPVTGG